jgi:hypothetical protein
MALASAMLLRNQMQPARQGCCERFDIDRLQEFRYP